MQNVLSYSLLLNEITKPYSLKNFMYRQIYILPQEVICLIRQVKLADKFLCDDILDNIKR